MSVSTRRPQEYKGHYIRGNKKCQIPRRAVFFDTETRQKTLQDGNIEQYFHLATAVYQRLRGGKLKDKITWLETTHDKELYSFIVDKCNNKERLYVFSANIWFDLRVSNILQYLKSDGWKNKMLFVNGMSLILSFKKDKRHIVFLNIQNYFRVSVRKLGEIINLPKLDVDFESSSPQQLMTYCRRDTEIIYHSMNNLFKFVKEHDLGCFGYTFPSIAFNAYRHRFMKHKLLVHKDTKVTQLERESYFGARCECFKIGKFTNTKLIQVDINSMYPFVMKSFKYPVKLAYHGYVCNLDALEYFAESGCCVAKVELSTDEPVYPTKIEGKTVFPVGRFITTLNTPEIEYALKNNHITKVIHYAYYKSGFIFKDYIDYFYNLRLHYKAQKNKAYDTLCKGLMNSLYGKFGQKGDEIISDIEIDSDRMDRFTELDADTGKFITTTYFFGRMIRTIMKQLEGRHAIVSIASHVTAYGRMLLYKYLKAVGLNNIFYTDTDCIIMYDQKPLLKHIPISESDLGKFKIEKRADKIEIKGLKDYSFGGNIKIKGVTKKAKEIKHNVYEQYQFPGIYSELKKGLDRPYTVNKITKKLKRDYTKGDVINNGDIKPFKLEL